MRTLAIETGIEPDYEQRLIQSAKDAGWAVEVVFHIPFTKDFVRGDKETPLPNEALTHPATWFHGSIEAAKVAQEVTSWQVHANWSQLNCSAYYPLLKERLFQQQWTFTTLEEFKAEKEQFFSGKAVADGTLFCRPDGNDKVFTGGCISLDEFDRVYALMTFYDPPAGTKIVVAQPQPIHAEARFFVINGVVVTGSYYRISRSRQQVEAPEKLVAVARDVASFCQKKNYAPSPSWVLDLAENEEGWRIIEVGGSSMCGLYACDTDKIIKSLSRLL